MIKTKSKFNLWLACIVAVAVVAVCATAKKAEATQSITITPTSVPQSINPGESYQGTIQVLNQSDSSYDYVVYAAPYSVSGEDYNPSFVPIPGVAQVNDWVKVQSPKGHLDSYSATNLDYSISVPKSAAPGGYYAVIFVETAAKPLNTTGVITKQRVGTVLYIRANGPIKEAGRVLSWNVDWFQFPPLKQTVRIENSGGSYFPATIHTTVRDLFGSSKYDFSQTKQILPQKIRRIDIVWAKTPALGLFKVGGTVTMLGKTEVLATKYVLVASQGVRDFVKWLVVVLILLLIIRIIYRRRKRKRAGNGSSKPPSDNSQSGATNPSPEAEAAPDPHSHPQPVRPQSPPQATRRPMDSIRVRPGDHDGKD